jgi:hypothetical protein
MSNVENMPTAQATVLRSLVEHFYGGNEEQIKAHEIAARTGLGVPAVQQALVRLHDGGQIHVADSEEGGIDRVAGVPYEVAKRAHPAFMEEAWRRRTEETQP